MYILKQKYVPPTRPYSQLELLQAEKDLRSRLLLTNDFVEYSDCGHFYLTKQGGSNRTGKCSVCWKFKQTDNSLKEIAENLILEYCRSFLTPPTRLTYEILDLETCFYKWLYGV